MFYMGIAAGTLAAYNIGCGMLHRLARNEKAAMSDGIEAALWSIAAVICFK